MSRIPPRHPADLPLDRAALPVKDAMRLVRDTLRRRSRRAREGGAAGFPPIPVMVALATDEVLDMAESVARGIRGEAAGARRLEAFPRPVGEYRDGGGADARAPRRLFVATHYAVAKHLLARLPERAQAPGCFVSEAAIDAAWRDMRALLHRSADDPLAQVAALTLALVRHRPIRSAPLAAGEAGGGRDPNRPVFATAGLATAAATMAGPGEAAREGLLELARDVVLARPELFDAAFAAADPQAALRRVFADLAPLLL